MIKHIMKRNARLIFIILSVFSIFVGFVIISDFFPRQYIPTANITINEVNLDKIDDPNIKGHIAESKSGFIWNHIGFSYSDSEIQNESLYIRLTYGLVSGSPAKEFGIFLNENEKEVNKIFILGNEKEDTKLIWEK